MIVNHVLSYWHCQKLMATARNKHKGKPLRNNTRLYDCDGYYAIRYHNNVIMQIYPEGWQLFDGGWQTRTTKDRLNIYSPATVYQRNWEWRMHTGCEDYRFWSGAFLDNEFEWHLDYRDYINKKRSGI